MKPILTPALRAWPGCLALGLSVLVAPCAAQSAEGNVRTLRFSGFGSLGAAHISAPADWVYRRELSQPLNTSSTRFDLDTRLGLQVNYTPSSAFELVGQANLRRRAPAAPGSDAVEWAFAAWRPNTDWTLRLGRVNTDAFLMSDYRSVGLAYTFARPPVEFYAQLPASLDGADASWVWNNGNALWRAKAFTGKSRLTFDGNNSLDLRRLLGGMVSREADGLLLRASALQAQLSFTSPDLAPLLAGLDGLNALPVPGLGAQASALRSRLTLDKVKHTYVSVGIRYEPEDWLLGAELRHVTGSVLIKSSAGYASVGRRFGPVTVFGLASRIGSASQPAEAPPWGVQLAPVIGPAAAQQVQFLGSTAALTINGLAPRQSALGLGLRWDLDHARALKLQWDHIRVDANGSFLWGNGSPQAERAQVASVVLDFVF